MLLHLSREMTRAGQNDLENTSGWQLLAIGAICDRRGDNPRQAIFRSAQATLHALPTSGFRAVTVAVTVQQCSEEARVRGPGLRLDELPVDELPADELVAEQVGGRDRRRRRGASRSSLGGRRPVRGPGNRRAMVTILNSFADCRTKFLRAFAAGGSVLVRSTPPLVTQPCRGSGPGSEPFRPSVRHLW